jgi:hypothetical protein
MKFTFSGEPVQQSTKCSSKRDAATVESAYRHELPLGRIGEVKKRCAGLPGCGRRLLEMVENQTRFKAEFFP